MSGRVECVPVQSVARLVLDVNGLLLDFERPRNFARLAEVVERVGRIPTDLSYFAFHHFLWGRCSNHTRYGFEWHRTARVFVTDLGGVAVVPTSVYPHLRAHFLRESRHAKWEKKLGEHREDLISYVLNQLRASGPLTASAFSSPKRLPPGAKELWAKPGVAIQYLLASGEIVRYLGRTRGTLDLVERIIPQEYRDAPLADGDDWACRSAAERLILATPKEIALSWGIVSPRQAEEWCREAVQRGELTPATLEHDPAPPMEPSYILSDWRERLALAPEPKRGPRLLSPHDPAIRKADRRHRFFGLAPIPRLTAEEPKREGDLAAYPVLLGDRFVARVLARLEHKHRMMTVERVVWQPDADRAVLAEEVEASVHRLAKFAECEVTWVTGAHEG